VICSDFVDLAASIARQGPVRVVSSSTFVYAWNRISSQGVSPPSTASNIPVHFDVLAKQAMESALVWANERQRSCQAGDIMLAVILQADSVAGEALVQFGYKQSCLMDHLLDELRYEPGTVPQLVSQPGIRMVPSLPKALRDALGLKLSAIMTRASAGDSWETIWLGCKRWVDEVGDEYDLDPTSRISLARYLLDESQAIIKEVDPTFVLWSDLRQLPVRWLKRDP
jgi:hypothetical protein